MTENQVVDKILYPNTDAGLPLVSDEIARLIKVVNDLHQDCCQSDKIWNKAEVERPSLTKAIFEASDKIDEEYDRYKAKRSTWADIDKRIDDYFKTWEALHDAYNAYKK